MLFLTLLRKTIASRAAHSAAGSQQRRSESAVRQTRCARRGRHAPRSAGTRRKRSCSFRRPFAKRKSGGAARPPPLAARRSGPPRGLARSLARRRLLLRKVRPSFRETLASFRFFARHSRFFFKYLFGFCACETFASFIFFARHSRIFFKILFVFFHLARHSRVFVFPRDIGEF